MHVNFRFGEQHSFRGRQTICKFYDGNDIINDELVEIKSAKNSVDFERIFSEQYRHNRSYSKNAKFIEPYFDTQAILEPLSVLKRETCLCAKELFYRSDYILQQRQVKRPSQLHHNSSANAIKRLALDDSKNFDAFLQSANECYNTCIQHYLNNLDACNERAKVIARQQTQKRPATIFSLNKHSLTIETKLSISDDFLITTQLQKLSINLEKSTRINNCVRQSSTSHQSASSSSFRAMSCNDTNNNSTESTNHQIKDPPKIIFNDFSNSQVETAKTIISDSEKDFSENNSKVDKNCLTIPITNYCSEARPP